ncbi:hypothetical protein ACQ4PT_038778 [Festuca glaucescens]
MEAEAAALSQLQLQLLALVSDLRLTRDSACSLQWTIQMKDKQIAVISEKLNSHLALFNSVGKEVAAITQVLGDMECLVGEKENVVSELKGKVQRISVLEKDFVATATVECKSRIDTGSNQEQCPQSLKHSTIASPETVTETVEKPNCCHESKDIEMGNSSPQQQTNYVNPDLETEKSVLS